ncbi:MAG: YHS domain-containing (seleno)protein [Planctomycetota bacterium]
MPRTDNRSVFRFLTATAAAAAFVGMPVGIAGTAAAQAESSPSESLPAKDWKRNISEWDLNKKKLAIDGYDPVAYFAEGGGKAKKGKKNITHTHKGVTYRFATAKNRDLFKASPDRYEPQYGGWCAWAMSQGGKTEINPKSFIVKDDKLFLFYDGLFGDTKKDWKKGNHASLVTKADGEWNGMSGELPHSAPAPTG